MIGRTEMKESERSDKEIRIKHIINRAIHLLVYYAFARYLPVSYAPGGKLYRAIRLSVCRPLLGSCGRNVNIERGASFDRSVSIGSHSGIGINASIGRGTKIGSNVMMGPDVLIYTRNHETCSTDIPMTEQGYASTLPVTIGDDVWIGARVIILPGVTVGKGAVLGAGAVVSRDIPAYAVAVGNPCRVVKIRKLS
jgi:maltose O-acetyltransferase